MLQPHHRNLLVPNMHAVIASRKPVLGLSVERYRIDALFAPVLIDSESFEV